MHLQYRGELLLFYLGFPGLHIFLGHDDVGHRELFSFCDEKKVNVEMSEKFSCIDKCFMTLALCFVSQLV